MKNSNGNKKQVPIEDTLDHIEAEVRAIHARSVKLAETLRIEPKQSFWALVTLYESCWVQQQGQK